MRNYIKKKCIIEVNRDDPTMLELEELAAKLKQKVKILIHTGKFDDAEAVIKQLEQYWPGDAELAELKNKLQMD